MAAMDASSMHRSSLNNDHQISSDFWGDYENFLFETYTNPDPFGDSKSCDEDNDNNNSNNIIVNERRSGTVFQVDALDLLDEADTTAGSNLLGDSHNVSAPTTTSAREPRFQQLHSSVTNPFDKADISSHVTHIHSPTFDFSTSPQLISSPAFTSPTNVLASPEPFHLAKTTAGLHMEQPVTTRSKFNDPWADQLEKSAITFGSQSSPLNAPLSPPPSSRLGSGEDFDIFRNQSMPRTMAYSSPPITHIPQNSYYGFTPAGSPTLDSDPFHDKTDYLNTSSHYTTSTSGPSMNGLTSPHAFDSTFMDHSQPSVGLSFQYGVDSAPINDTKVQPWWPLDSSQSPTTNSSLESQPRHFNQRSLSTYANPSDLSNNGLMIAMPSSQSQSNHHAGQHRSLSLSADRSQQFAAYTSNNNVPPVPSIPRSRPLTSRQHSQSYQKYRSPSPSKAPSSGNNRRSVSKHYSSSSTSSSNNNAHRRARTVSSIPPSNGYSSSSSSHHHHHHHHSGGVNMNSSSGGDFVNFTPADSSKILTGVAPSGSSKTKARREKEAAEKRRKTFQAAARVILANGGDVKELEREGLTPYL